MVFNQYIVMCSMIQKYNIRKKKRKIERIDRCIEDSKDSNLYYIEIDLTCIFAFLCSVKL